MTNWIASAVNHLRHGCAPLAVACLLLLGASARAQIASAPDDANLRDQAGRIIDAPRDLAADVDIDIEDIVFRPLPPLHAAPAVAAVPVWAAPCAIDPAVVAMMNEAGNVLDVELPLGPGATVIARLRRFDVVAPDATIVDEGPGGVRTPVAITVSTWTGHLLDDPDADVFIGLSPTQAQGWVTTRGTTFLIATRPTPAGPLTLAYDQDDFDLPGALTPAVCQGAMTPPGQAAPSPTGDAGYQPRVACTAFRVAIETDQEFAAVAGGGQDAADYAVILVAANNIIYVRELGMGLRLSYLRIWSTTDPWSATNTSNQLSEFISYWEANMSSVSRASAHLFSGRGLGGGIAYVRAACVSGFGYAVSANLVASFPFPIEDNASSNWDLMVVAHEWGHQFGTGHTHNSCEYSPIIDGCGLRTTSSSCENGTQNCSVATAQNGTIMSYCHTCSGGMRNMKMTFGSRVVSRMNSYISGITSCGSSIQSPTLSFISPSPSAAVCSGVPVTLTASASGTELRFQWYRNGTRVFGATAASHTVAFPVDGDRWDVMVYSPCGVILTQGTDLGVVLSVGTAPPVIVSQPASLAVCVGAAATFTVVPGAGTTPTYEWFKNGTLIPGATQATYSIASASESDDATFECRLTNGCGSVFTSKATLSVGGQWTPGDGLPGVGGQVDAMIMWDPDGTGPQSSKLVVAGVFSLAGNVTANNIALFDPQTSSWSSLGAGLGGPALALAVLQSGELVAGGAFTTAGGATANAVARWNGSAWSAVGSGMNGIVKALAVRANGDLVAGGTFTTAGGVAANSVARWNGSAWSALGSGMNSTVNALAVRANGDLVAGGTFTTAGGVTANRIARWDGFAWSALATGLNDAAQALATLPSGDLVVGGLFTTAGGAAANQIARWNGSAWSALGTGMNFGVSALTTLPNGDLVAGGAFTSAGGVAASRMARWNGSSWSSLASGISGPVRAIAVLPAGDVIAGGSFENAGGVGVNALARWNGTSWSAMATGFNTELACLAAMPGGDLIAGGRFSSAGAVAASRIARWNGTAWSALGTGMNDSVLALAVMPTGDLIAAGQFTLAGGLAANRIARWNGSAWSALGAGMDGDVSSLAVLPNGDLIAGGSFTSAGDIAASRIARWNGSAWAALGGGMDGPVRSLTVLPNGDLIAGGAFTTASGLAVNRIARWNGSAWFSLGPGLDGFSVDALAVLPDGNLVAGGRFFSTWDGSVSLNSIARWNGVAWSPLGAGFDISGVASLAVLPNGHLVAGGRFTSNGSGDYFTPSIARWNGSEWSSMGPAMVGPAFETSVSALAVLPGGDMIAGGQFWIVGGQVSARVARFSTIAGPPLVGHPASQTLCPSQTLTLTASPANGYANVSYQWRRNGVSIVNGPGGASAGGGVVGGASGTLPSPTASSVATLTISSFASSDAGTYVCVFTNACGSTFTNSAVVGANLPPVITSQPVTQIACLGSAATFTVAATGSPAPSFQWRKGGANIAGATSASLTIPFVSSSDLASYACVVTNACGSVTSQAVDLLSNTAPVITVQPTSRSACAGTSTTFTVTPAGTPPITLQWRKNGITLPGATAASFTIASVAAADAASYDCVVTNSCGSVTSTAATLTVNVAPSITTQPTSRAACAGTSTTFTVAVSGSPTFQWRKGGVNISGATAASFTIASVAAADAASYDCVVTNACASVTSAAATLTVNVAPSITTQPTSRAACAGTSTTFTVAASGSPTFQWRKGGVNISGATAASFTIASVVAADAASYDCVVTNSCGSVTSTAAALTVNVAPSITTQPTSRAACAGTSTTFTVAASGSPTFQWRKGGVNISGATAASFTLASVAAADAASYDCVVTNACGSVTSAAATLSVSPVPSITTQPSSRSACPGSSTTFTVAASGSLTFQWRKAGTNISGATAASFTIASVAAADAASYDCVVTNACGSVTSSAATLSLNAAPVITTQPTARTACPGTSTTFTVVATGTPAPTFQWRKAGVNISGATAASFTIASVAATDAASYDCVVTNACGSVTSSAATLILGVTPAITTQPASTSACPGTSTTFTVVATGTPAPTFQWRKAGVNISGATAASFTIASVAAADAASYTCVITNACGSVTSSAATLSLNAAPTITTQPTSRTVCAGTSTTFTVVATGTPSPTFQWRKAGVNISGATAASFTIASVAATDAASYDCVVTNSCAGVTSSAASLTVNAAPVITTQPAALSACPGTAATFTVVATGSPTFQWRKNGTNISGATAASFTIASVSAADAAAYTCVVTNACGSVTSSAATLTLGGGPTITTQPASRSACLGTSTTFTVVATGSPTFQWRKAGVNIAGATAASYTIASVAGADAASYDCIVTNTCGSVTSSAATLTTLSQPVITTQPASRAACSGTSVTFTVVATGSPTFQWRKDGANISGATAASFTIPAIAAADAASYDCVLTNICASVTSSAATLTLNATPVITSQPVSVAACAGSSATFTVVATGSPTFQWRKGGTNIGGATAASFTIASVAASDLASYDCVLTNACGSVTSAAAALTLGGGPTITSQPASRSACIGSSATLTVVATGSPTFQWRKAGVDISGATAASFTIASFQAADAGSYDCVVTNACGSVTSAAASLTVGAAPTITTQPTSRSACSGRSTTLSVVATGSPTFQWRKGGVNISGATSASYTIASFQAADAGSYDCVVTNACGSVTSAVATVTAIFPPTFTTQPTSRVACTGASTTFTVVASGTPSPTFQWRKGGVNITGATSASFTIASVSAADAGSYTCVVTNACASVTSSAATLTVNASAPNDLVANAQLLVAGVARTGDTSCATVDAADAPVCASQPVTAPGLWYRLGGTGTSVTVSLCGSSFDTRLSVFCGSPGSLTCVAGNDDSCSLQSSVTFCSQAGADYYVLVHGFQAATGPFTILATASPSPCSNPVACLPVGACCVDGGCTQLNAEQCDQIGGTFLGVGTPCDTVSYADLFQAPGPFPVSILDFSTASASIVVPPGSGNVDGLAVRLNLAHTFVGDLTITLTHGATTVTLVSASGSDADLDGLYTFSDAATMPFAAAALGAALVPPGEYKPAADLAAFIGQPFDGPWVLSVLDQFSGDTGQLRSFILAAAATSPACNACPPCVADYNLDGGVDSGDLASFFDAWELAQSCADVNLDGGIDFGDAADFFAAWENGGC